MTNRKTIISHPRPHATLAWNILELYCHDYNLEINILRIVGQLIEFEFTKPVSNIEIFQIMERMPKNYHLLERRGRYRIFYEHKKQIPRKRPNQLKTFEERIKETSL